MPVNYYPTLLIIPDLLYLLDLLLLPYVYCLLLFLFRFDIKFWTTINSKFWAFVGK